ncbi:MAG: biopolymer transporter Tol [Cryobacterium sp.]
MDYRRLAPGQTSRVHIGYRDGRASEVIFETDSILIEAPNWTLDGVNLIVNGNGRLFSLASDGSAPLVPIPLTGVPALNNDHVLAPDGEHIFVSANDWHIYRASLAGGATERITNAGVPQRLHFLHGVSPDGQTLAYIGLDPEDGDVWGSGNVFTIPSAGGDDIQLTTGGHADDGAEYSPDGEWIYFNTEAFEAEPGHAQIARMRVDGSQVEQLTFDNRVHWFPHLSPDGRSAVYLSFPPGTEGHPADVWVQVKVVESDEWASARTVQRLFGGQGTLNVNSWSPDGERFAYVSYPNGRGESGDRPSHGS